MSGMKRVSVWYTETAILCDNNLESDKVVALLHR